MLSSSLQLMQRMASNLVARIADSTFSAHGYGCVGAWTLPVCGPSCSVVVFQRAARSTRESGSTLADFVPMNVFSLRFVVVTNFVATRADPAWSPDQKMKFCSLSET